MKRSIIIIAALLVAACNNKPTTFGIDVEARTNMLSSSVRNSIVSARLLVSGAETFQKDIAGVAKAAQSGAFKFRYVPGVHSGTVTIRVDGLDGSGATVAGGTAPPVNIADGKAVDAVLTLAINGNGVTCMAGTDCISGNCVDGVCCDTPCDGVCESCNQPGLAGACSPAMTGTDPDNDCAAKLPPPMTDDGGVDDDGGTGSDLGGVTGVMANPQACAGTCNGMRACTFADTTTSCGMNFCSAIASVGSFFCDGNGTCGEKDNMCTDYVCDTGGCKTLCSGNTDCQAVDFCNLNTNKCVPKHDIGTMCNNGAECKSGFCASGVCCDTACTDTGQSCNMGMVGHCQCAGHNCGTASCQLFYRDADVDTYGDKTGTIANGRAVVGCVGDPASMHSGFVADNTDCDDADANAHPGQTAFFATTSAGVHTFDYNCDGDPNGPEKETAEFVGGSCGFCSGGIGSCAKNATCAASGNTSAFSCGLTRVGQFYCFCCNLVTSAFTGTINCGQTGTVTNC
ncbi:MAG TPA: hypothetical protein VHB97_22600, partial [Polyangia bacterium]|nr:hypothetical protein [Polyangia bacterium]